MIAIISSPFLDAARYCRIWCAQARYSTVRELMFQMNFFLWIIVELAWFSLHLIFIKLIYLQVHSVAGWDQWAMVLLVTTNQLIQQVFQAFFMINCMKLPELVRTGKLDFYLAQPASTQFLVSTRLFELGALLSALLASVVVLVALAHFPGVWTPLGLVLYLALLVCGVLVHYSLLLSLVSLSFWMKRAQGFINAYYSIFQIARLPREAFSGISRLVLTWFVPLLLIANVPASTLLRGPHWPDLLLLLGITLFLLVVSNRIFALGLRHYGSASS